MIIDSFVGIIAWSSVEASAAVIFACLPVMKPALDQCLVYPLSTLLRPRSRKIFWKLNDKQVDMKDLREEGSMHLQGINHGLGEVEKWTHVVKSTERMHMSHQPSEG